MIAIVALAAFLAGAGAGTAILWRMLPATLKHHVDYKQRWEDAISLLGAQGQLTPEQVDQITGGQAQAAPEPSGTREPASALSVLHSMATWDRRDLEVARAKKGLPPIDDLAGMASWDVREVLKARAGSGT